MTHRWRCSNFDKYPQFQDYNMLTDCSKVISENVHFWYLTTHRWRCSQLWHVSSDHGVDEAYQVSFQLIKVWPRYSLWTNFWVDFVVHNIITCFFTSSQKFCSVISVRLGPKIIWVNFDKNWTDFEGGSSENTVFHLLQNGWQTPSWKITNETSLESAQPRERNNIRMIHFGQHFQKL